MKVLRLYDHLGELKKEFNVYVEGEDFKWQSSYPEPVWLGTITLEDAGKEPEKPSEVVSEPLQPEVEETLPEVIEEPSEPSEAVLEPSGKEPEEVKDEPKKVHGKRSRVKGSSPSDYLKSVKVIRQDDSGGDTNQGD